MPGDEWEQYADKPQAKGDQWEQYAEKPAAPNAGLAPAAGAPPKTLDSGEGPVAETATSFATQLSKFPGAIYHQGKAALLPFSDDARDMRRREDAAHAQSVSEGGGLEAYGKEIGRMGHAFNPVAHTSERPNSDVDWGATAANVLPLAVGGSKMFRNMADLIPAEEVATAPVRLAARTAEGVVNSSPLRYVRGASKLFTPADQARRMIKVPGRDFGLAEPLREGAPYPEQPPASVMQARGLQTGGYAPAEPSRALATIPPTGALPDTSLAVRPSGKIGGRYVLTPEEAAQADQIQRIAARRASQRGMQYAAGIRPSEAKIPAP